MDELKSNVPEALTSVRGRPAGRVWVYGVFLAALVAAFSGPLIALVRHASGSELHSHIVLIPFVSVYLLVLQRAQLPRKLSSSVVAAAGLALVALAAVATAWSLIPGFTSLSHNDVLALMTLAFLCLLAAGGFAFLGAQWMAAAAFPIAFLLFMIPLPDQLVEWLETASKLASAEAANLLFNLTGTPTLRNGAVFRLPMITIEVAQECSGIRSSWVLFITSLVASHLFLNSPWRRIALVAFVIPLGIIRNGIRITTIGLLCIHVGRHMIDSPIHHRGGPVFFALSLIPLFLFLWWLRRAETKSNRPMAPTPT